MTSRDLFDADMATIGRGCATAFDWWLGEMAAILPRRWRERSSKRLTLALWDPLADAWAEPARGRRNGNIAMVLPPGLTLQRMIETPVMNERDLAGMVALGAARIMPLDGEHAVLAARVVAKDPAARHMQVEVGALARTDAERIGHALARAGRKPVRIYGSPPDADGPVPIDYLPALRRAGLARSDSRTVTTAWVVIGFLLLLNIGLLVWRDSAAVDAISSLVDQQRSAVSVAHRIVGRMRAQDRIVADSLAARRDREPLAILARIDQALPPGCWLQKLNWTGDTVRLSGFHRHGTDVAGALRHAGLPVVRYGDAGEAATPLGEPFEITVRLAAAR